jgi:hypothetical protein
MKSRDGQRLLQRKRRKQAWQSLRQHRLARTWRSNEKQVVSAGCRHLQSATTDSLSSNLREIRPSL